MSIDVISVSSVTALWGLVGLGSLLVPKGENRGLIQVIVVLTAVCCYLFWVLAYMHQLNPLIGPELNNATLRYMKEAWRTL